MRRPDNEYYENLAYNFNYVDCFRSLSRSDYSTDGNTLSNGTNIAIHITQKPQHELSIILQYKEVSFS